MEVDSITPAAGSTGAARSAVPSGIWALARIAAFHQRPVDPDQILRALGLERREIGVAEILLASAELHLKSREVQCGWDDLSKFKLPSIVLLNDGRFAVAGRMRDQRIPLTSQGDPQPQWLERDSWEATFSGSAIVINERLTFSNPNRPFGFGWFLPVLGKFRKELTEVLVAALFFQLQIGRAHV